MSAIVLANSTGNDEVDRVLRLTIDALETTLPGLFRGYYVLGSHASGTALPTSDLDLAFEGHAGDDVQRARTKEVLAACRAATVLDIGVFPVSVDDLGLYNPVFKLRSLFVYGHDIRAALPLLPVEEWARKCMHGIY